VLGGLNAFYLLMDTPETYGLPAEVVPKVPSRIVWPSSVKSVAASLAIALGAFLAFGKRRRAVAQAEAEGG
jgi:formate dehydrogenase iron-sulfur subunit